MKLVKQDFHCTQEKKHYKEGDVYTGPRTDIDYLLYEDKQVKPKTEKKSKSRK